MVGKIKIVSAQRVLQPIGRLYQGRPIYVSLQVIPRRQGDDGIAVEPLHFHSSTSPGCHFLYLLLSRFQPADFI